MDKSNYSHLNLQQRYEISTLFNQGHSKAEIARNLGVHPSTIGREIKRNTPKAKTYCPENAQEIAHNRRTERQPYKATDELLNYVKTKLKTLCSPEQIVGRMKHEKKNFSVSHETIYKWIYNNTLSDDDYRVYLRQKKKQRRNRLLVNEQRGRIPNTISIHERPLEVDEKQVFGHWEADTMVFAGKQGGMLTLVERVTKFLITTWIPDRKAETVSNAIIRQFKAHRIAVKSITYDNGKEFTNHIQVNEKLGCKSYFCDPYSSWQRGLNENTNGLLRQYIPKNKTISEVTHADVMFAKICLNNRPRKNLHYHTPLEYLHKFT